MKKKRYILFLIFMFVVIGLSGCQDTPKEFGAPIQSYDSEDFIWVDNNSENTGFVVKEKTFAYDNGNVLVLDVKNETGNNYSVKLFCTFYDQNDKAIKSETKFFEGWSAGYQNYFIFQPNVKFEYYKYQISFNEYSEVCYVNYLNFCSFTGIQLQESKRSSNGNYAPESYIALDCIWEVDNTYDKELFVSPVYIVFDNKGEIYKIDDRLQSISFPEGHTNHSRRLFVTKHLWNKKSSYILPEELKGGINALVAIQSVSCTNNS